MLKQLSPETAIKLAKELGIPIEQLVHTPRHIVLAKLAELAKRQTDEADQENTGKSDQEQANKAGQEQTDEADREQAGDTSKKESE